jgi:hypothetical protein
MDLPTQSPPVVRWYFRDIVGRRGKKKEEPSTEARPSKAKKKGRKGKSQKNEPEQTGDCYVIEPTVVHIRPPRRL